jgi:hypothetical protein
MDADLSHRPSFLQAFWRHRHDAEILIASRYVPGGRADVGVVRRALSIILNRVYARALTTPVRDLSSGFRMYRRDVLAGLPVVSRNFDMLEEILIRVDADGWRIREIPFHYMSRGSGRSHVRLVRFGWAYLTTLVRMWRFRNSIDAADYDARAYDSPIWLQRYWQRARHRIVLDFVRGCEHVLDVGCGSSRMILDLANAIGLDIRQNKLRWLSWRRSRLVRASCERLPFADGSFDGPSTPRSSSTFPTIRRSSPSAIACCAAVACWCSGRPTTGGCCGRCSNGSTHASCRVATRTSTSRASPAGGLPPG